MTGTMIIGAADLLKLHYSAKNLVFLDVRFSPDDPNGRDRYEQAHIPGAHFVDLPQQLQGKPLGYSGARPLPDVDDLQYEIERWGINQDSTVIVYSDTTHSAAARAWFVLRWAGVWDVRLLDGGLDAWICAGGQVTQMPPAEGGGTFAIVSTGHLPVLDADDVATVVVEGVTLLDARKAEAFRGDISDVRSGHIPGAISAPASSLLTSGGTVRQAGELAEFYASLGLAPGDSVAVYCGGGVAGALQTLVLQSLGYDAKLFVGSFSGWVADPRRPIEQA